MFFVCVSRDLFVINPDQCSDCACTASVTLFTVCEAMFRGIRGRKLQLLNYPEAGCNYFGLYFETQDEFPVTLGRIFNYNVVCCIKVRTWIFDVK